jgi:uncharacterized protein
MTDRRSPSFAAIADAMRKPSFYPHRVSEVETRETHISLVFLAGKRAYKVKKPVLLPFVDYRRLAHRRAMCQAEVDLNQRLAPDVYLGVRSIVPDDGGLRLGNGDDPVAVEYAVEMRRFDEMATLAHAVRTRPGGVDVDVAAVGRRLAEFHAACPALRDPEAALLRLRRTVAETFTTLQSFADSLGRERLVAAERFAQAFIAGREEHLATRARAGLVREGHGDLRAEHVVVEGGRISIVDCVEFDRALREIDVGADLAFLVMDLVRLGAPELADQLVAAYRAAGGDPDDDATLAFNAAERACVRAKVACLRGGQGAIAEAGALLGLAERFAWRSRLPLALVVAGAPGAGKSHLAAALAAESGLCVVSSDETRKRLAGVEPTRPAPAGAYSPAASGRVYRQLGVDAAQEMARTGGVIVDATFRRRADRDSFAAGFTRAGPPPLVVECRAPREILLARARARDRGGPTASDATAQVVERLSREFEPLDEVAPERHVVLRADRPAKELVDDLRALLDRRLRTS